MTSTDKKTPELSDTFEVSGKLVRTFKGENGPQSPAGLYMTDPTDLLGLASAGYTQLDGPELSYNNFTDVDCGLQTMSHLVAGFDWNFARVPSISLGIKHGNVCGAAVGTSAMLTIEQMVVGEREAIFGGTVMTNFTIGLDRAQALRSFDLQGGPKRIFDVVLAAGIGDGVVDELKRKDEQGKVFENSALRDPGLDTHPRTRYVRGGFMVQPNYQFVLDLADPAVEFYGPELTEQDRRDIVFGWGVGCTSNSNTITAVRNGMLIANAVGQQKRNRAAWLAVEIAKDNGHSMEGCVVYSDSFFPFFDAPEILVKAGVRVIFASHGGVRVQSVIDGCEKAGVSLVLAPDSMVRGFYKH